MDSNQQYPTMWTTGYIGGVKVSFTFPIRNEMTAYEQANAIIGKLLADGFTAHEPGLEAGEKREPIGYVLRREKADGTPVIDLYLDNERWVNRIVMCYLDTPEDIAAFEQATGSRLQNLPIYEGDRLERGDNEKAKRYIRKLVTPAMAVIKDNPAYNPDETDVKKKKPARLFLRWDSASVGTPTPSTPAQPAVSEPDYAAIERAEREKAAKALDNEAVTIIEWRYEPNHNGQGVPRWNAKATVADGATIPVALYSEHMTALKKAGFPTPNDAGNLAIDVITVKNGTERRISAILTPDGKTIPVTQENALNAHFNADNPPAWIFDFTKLMYALRDLTSVSGQEKANTVNKMHADNEFEKVSSLDAAALMVRNRLAAHRQQKAG